MNPRWIEEMSWRMGEVYGAVVDRILINLARHFPYIAEGATPGGSWDYQIRKLAELGQVTRETEAIILESMKGADAALAELLEETIRESIKKVDPELRKAAEKGLLLGEGFLPPETAPNMTQAFKAYYQQSADKLNLVNTVMLESTQQAYRTTVADIAVRMENAQGILNTATGEVVSGVSSLNQAVRDAVQKMVDNGITGYIDHGDHHWSPEAYVTMDIRTTLANTAREAVTEQMHEYGCDLFTVSWHDGARPLCYPWQGKVISESNWTGEVEDLDGNKVHVYALNETSYGEAAGLFGINCGHYKIPFIPGFSKARQPEQNEEQNAKEYEESQKQRALERKLREEKRDLEVLKAQGASDEEIKAQRVRVNNARKNLDDFCEETDRARKTSRERTPINANWPDTPSRGSFGSSTEEGAQLVGSLEKKKIVPIEPERWDKIPDDFTLVRSIGGGDRTEGSCSSVAFAYAGNKGGYKVYDFKGGNSQKVFADNKTIEKICKLPGVEGIIKSGKNEIALAEQILKKAENGKEYYFAIANHSAIIKKTGKLVQYYEMQSQQLNGFYNLTEKALYERFGCFEGVLYKPSKAFLISVDNLSKSDDFISLLKYINAGVSGQQKGIGGGIR